MSRPSSPVRTVAGRERPLPPHVLRHRPQRRPRPPRLPRVTARRRPGLAAADGQAAILLLGALMAVLAGAFVLGAVAKAVGTRDSAQRTADLAALAGAKAMHVAYPRLFEPAVLAGRPNPRHLEKTAYLALGRAAAIEVARRNGAAAAATLVGFPDADTLAPVRVRVTVERALDLAARRVDLSARAEAELAPPAGSGPPPFATGGGYDGPLAYRQGEPMRPDVALAFDRMARAARADGVDLVVASGFRSDAEQAVLFARNPDPKWVAPPGTSLHRNATELDLGPRTAYDWLAANAPRFHFTLRYAWTDRPFRSGAR